MGARLWVQACLLSEQEPGIHAREGDCVDAEVAYEGYSSNDAGELGVSSSAIPFDHDDVGEKCGKLYRDEHIHPAAQDGGHYGVYLDRKTAAQPKKSGDKVGEPDD